MKVEGTLEFVKQPRTERFVMTFNKAGA
jgi:hypothetical protein